MKNNKINKNYKLLRQEIIDQSYNKKIKATIINIINYRLIPSYK